MYLNSKMNLNLAKIFKKDIWILEFNHTYVFLNSDKHSLNVGKFFSEFKCTSAFKV